MNSITQNHQDEELLSKKMQVFFRRYQVSRILRAANAYKLRGVPVLSWFSAWCSSSVPSTRKCISKAPPCLSLGAEFFLRQRHGKPARAYLLDKKENGFQYEKKLIQ